MRRCSSVNRWKIIDRSVAVSPFDSRFESPQDSIVDKDHQLLLLPSDFLVGGYNLRLITETTNGLYTVYGTTGTVVPEVRPTVSKPVKVPGGVTVHVTAGDPGRNLALQASTNLSNWFFVSGWYTTYYSGYDPGFTLTNTVSSPRTFFRVIGN